jgi:hypothetical protein
MRIWFSFILAAAVAAGQPLSQGDRSRLLSELHATRKTFLDSITGLSTAQWKFKPAPDRWSIAECAEHVALAEDALFKTFREKVMTSPPVKRNAAEVRKQDEEILARVSDRSQKAQAPMALRPTGRWPDAASVAAHFRESRDRLLDYVRSTQDDLRSHVAPMSPGGPPMDGFQWLLLIAVHTGRHVEQIEEVKASPGYPK